MVLIQDGRQYMSRTFEVKRDISENKN